MIASLFKLFTGFISDLWLTSQFDQIEKRIGVKLVHYLHPFRLIHTENGILSSTECLTQRRNAATRFNPFFNGILSSISILANIM